MEAAEQPNEFEVVKVRLEEIARLVDDDSLSLDEALDLYEEAVKLGLQASDLLEVGIVVEEEQAAEGADSVSGSPIDGRAAEGFDSEGGLAQAQGADAGSDSPSAGPSQPQQANKALS